MTSLRYVLALALVAALIAACGDARPLASGAGPSSSLRPLPTLGLLGSASPTEAPTSDAIPTPPATPTAITNPTGPLAPSATPGASNPRSAPPATPTATPPPSRIPFPSAVRPSPSAGESGGLPEFTDAQLMLLAHVPGPLQAACSRYERHSFAFDVATIQCRATDAITLFYTLFRTASDLDRGFDTDSRLLQDRSGEECVTGAFLGTYTSVTGTPGRLMCRDASGGSGKTTRIIEWSHPDLLILSYAVTTASSWQALYDAWIGAGPVGDQAGPQPSSQPTPSVAPTATPEPSVVVEPSPSATFTSSERKLLEHIPDDLQATCFSIAPLFKHEVEGLECRGPGTILISYYQFASRADMDTDFEFYVQNDGKSPPATDTCSSGNSRGTYTIGGRTAGKYACVHIVDDISHIDYAVITWTDIRLNIMAVAFSAKSSWRTMIDFYENDAGPNL